MLKKIFLLAILCCLVSCGPIYRTHFEYVSPKTSHGGECANSCLRVKQQCETRIRDCNNRCLSEEQNCEMNEKLVDAAMTIIKKDHNNKKRNDYNAKCSNNRYYCERNCEEDCLGNYNICYQNCGGKVIAHKKCEMFCDQEQ